jgi:hypothetical protein
VCGGGREQGAWIMVGMLFTFHLVIRVHHLLHSSLRDTRCFSRKGFNLEAWKIKERGNNRFGTK